jgi:nucleoside phosphorylase
MSVFLSSDEVVAIDMEGYSIEAVCDRWGYTRMYLKVLYDEIGVDNIKKYDDMLLVLEQSLVQLPDMLRKIL